MGSAVSLVGHEMMANCPHCKKPLTRVRATKVDVVVVTLPSTPMTGLVYACARRAAPRCPWGPTWRRW